MLAMAAIIELSGYYTQGWNDDFSESFYSDSKFQEIVIVLVLKNTSNGIGASELWEQK